MKERNVARLYLGGEANPDELANHLQEQGIEGATILPATGIWKGNLEKSRVIEIIGINTTKAKQLKEQLEQKYSEDSVMLQHNQTRVTF